MQEIISTFVSFKKRDAMEKFELSSTGFGLSDINSILKENKKVVLSKEATDKIKKCRKYLDKKVEETKNPIYGINTGFGSLYDRSISAKNLSQLQENLVKSHACGTGEEVPQDIVKLMLLLKAKGLSLGHSGVQLNTVQRLLDMYNENILPVIYQQGSLGASGDLAPLAHLSLPLLGMGEVYFEGKKIKAKTLLSKKKWKPIALRSKEGLALLNGTQFMSSYASWLTIESKKIIRWADLIGTLSLDAFDGRIEPFADEVHIVRNHPGQLHTARVVKALIGGSKIIEQEKTHVQDPYSFRCIPQVHGATKDTINYIQKVVEREINAVTDNPTIFPDQDLIISAGNFHGQPLALVLDQMAIAIAELGSISERRIYKLISGQRDLPPFLVANPGLNSGFMIPQYTAASIVSQNKSLCMPSSVDTIDSSNGQEDHVSMGANAATKSYRVIQNVKQILAIELLNAVQAIEFRRPLKSSNILEGLVEAFRKEVPRVENDVYMHDLIIRSLRFLDHYQG